MTLTKDALKQAVAAHPNVAATIGHIAEERFASYTKQQDEDMYVNFGEELKLGMTQTDLKAVSLGFGM